MCLIGFPMKDNSYKKDIIFFFLRFIESLGKKHQNNTNTHIFTA